MYEITPKKTQIKKLERDISDKFIKNKIELIIPRVAVSGSNKNIKKSKHLAFTILMTLKAASN
jgi:hypothetical protein